MLPVSFQSSVFKQQVVHLMPPKESVICGTIKALMHQIGFDKFITHEQLACAFLGNWELKLAISSWCYYVLNVWEILKEKDRTGKPVILALMTDHGNRKCSGFFAKLLVWCQCEDGEWALKFFCLDINNNSDHTDVGAAKTVAESLARFGLSIGKDIVLELLVGDSRGGPEVFRLHDQLMIFNVKSIVVM
jgi:hypothetical protein